MALENNQIENSNIDNDEISLKEIVIKVKEWVSFLKTKWKTIFIAGIIGALIGLTISLLVRPRYKAVTTFAMEEDKSSGGGGLSGAIGLASSFGIDLGGAGGGGAFAATNLAELMKSRLLVEKILLNPIEVEGKTISIAEYYIQTNNLREKWKKNLEYKNIKFEINSNPIFFTPQQVEVISNIYNDLVSKKNMLIGLKSKEDAIPQISITNEHELFAKLFCENLLAGTSEFYIETKSKRAKKNLKNLEEQLDSVRRKYNNSLTSFATSSESLFNLNTANKIKSTTSLNRQIDVQSLAALLPPLIANIENAKATLTNATPLFQIIETPILPLPKENPSFFKVILLYSTTFFLTIMTILFLLQYYIIKINNSKIPLKNFINNTIFFSFHF